MHGPKGLAALLAATLALGCSSPARPVWGYQPTESVEHGFYTDYELCLKQIQPQVEREHRGFLPPISDQMRTTLRSVLSNALIACIESRGWIVLTEPPDD